MGSKPVTVQHGLNRQGKTTLCTITGIRNAVSIQMRLQQAIK
jgi:hypothetical protein